MSSSPGEATPEAEAPPEPPPVPLLELRDGLPPVITTDSGLIEVCRTLDSGTGPFAIDAERASGYRYSSRAYLIQVRREGAGTFLIDPIEITSLHPLHEAMSQDEWILHAATQDLPCLAEVGLRPHRLFDTELAGRLLNYPRVGLATLTETLLGQRMRKEHSAVDWSTRPLPAAWLTYAALDVEALIELRNLLAAQLIEADKWTWAEQEFEALLSFEQTVRAEAWRRTTGIHKVRGRRGLGAVRALWEARDEIARERDVTPSRIIPDSAIVVAAQSLPTERSALLGLRGFHGRGAERYSSRWVTALRHAIEMPEDALPTRSPQGSGPPLPRAWADKDPIAAARLVLAREGLTDLAQRHQLPVENLLTPDHVRRALWSPPETREPAALGVELGVQLRAHGAREWQIELVTPVLVTAIVTADEVPEIGVSEPDYGDEVGDGSGVAGGDNTS
jgi:ribonuclease D